MSGIILLLPLFFAFEVWQLVMSERYLGVKTLASGADPRDLGLSEAVACGWSLTLLAYWLWMTLLLFVPGQAPLDLRLDKLPKSALVSDIIYIPRETPLIQMARERGHRTVTGLGMLLHQGAAAFRQWTGVEPPLQAMRAALLGH